MILPGCVRFREFSLNPLSAYVFAWFKFKKQTSIFGPFARIEGKIPENEHTALISCNTDSILPIGVTKRPVEIVDILFCNKVKRNWRIVFNFIHYNNQSRVHGLCVLALRAYNYTKETLFMSEVCVHSKNTKTVFFVLIYLMLISKRMKITINLNLTECIFEMCLVFGNKSKQPVLFVLALLM